MDVLVVGSGAREHAIAWKLRQSPKVRNLYVVPGTHGTSSVAWNISIETSEMEVLLKMVQEFGIGLVVIGPEGPLAEGMVDRLSALTVPVPAFGPTRDAAQLETSKSFALGVMVKASVPHPESWVFLNPEVVITFAKGYGKPIVVKADGLAQGKGVWLCHTIEEVERAANLCWKLFPEQHIVVQELLEGREVSVFCFTDGWNISPLVAACDYKRLLNGDQGPNTGGMGSYAWPEFWDGKLDSWVRDWVMRPVLREMQRRGTPFQGMLYAGLMLTEDGPKVLEFNARFGDPEAQVILPLLEGDLLEIMQACTDGNLDKVQVSWNRALHTVGVVMASHGYPGKYGSGYPIEGLNGDLLVFHASTKSVDGRVVTDNASGRVLTVVGLGSSLKRARESAYTSLETISFEKAVWRKDIGEIR